MGVPGDLQLFELGRACEQVCCEHVQLRWSESALSHVKAGELGRDGAQCRHDRLIVAAVLDV